MNYDNEYVVIQNNVSLESINIQNSIIGNLYIINNPSLTDLNADSISGVWDWFRIENNSSLSTCNVEFVCSHFAGSAFWSVIQNNASGCENRVEVELACGLPPFNDDCSSNGPNFLVNIGEPISFNNELATMSSNSPSCNDIVNRQDVWFVFNSMDLTSVDIIAEAGFSIQLWEGDCNNLQQVNNACGSGSLFDIPVTPDVYYWVQIWSETNKRPAGWFDVTVQDGALSIPENDINNISMFPNPVINILNVNATLPIDVIEFYNMLGQKVQSYSANSKAVTIDVSGLNSGLYLTKIISGNKETIYKIVKQ